MAIVIVCIMLFLYITHSFVRHTVACRGQANCSVKVMNLNELLCPSHEFESGLPSPLDIPEFDDVPLNADDRWKSIYIFLVFGGL